MPTADGLSQGNVQLMSRSIRILGAHGYVLSLGQPLHVISDPLEAIANEATSIRRHLCPHLVLSREDAFQIAEFDFLQGEC